MSGAGALREQQRALARAVVDGDDAAGLFAPNARGGPPLLDAYRFAYGARLVAALKDNHEILARAMGDEAFDALARAYLAEHPSRTPSIRWFGAGLADFMAARAGGDGPFVPHPALVDFARMDRALRDAFDAADAAPLSREQALGGVAPADFAALRFAPHPSLRLIDLEWAIEPAWRALREAEDDPGDDGAEPELPAPARAPHALLVWRQGLQTRFRSLDDGEALLMRAMLAGEPFADWCEKAAVACGSEDRAAVIAATALLQWLDEGSLGARL